MPAHHGSQANDYREQPANGNDASGALSRHQAVVSERDLDGDVPVDGDGQQTEDGALRQHQHEAGDEEAAVEVGAEPGADGDGEGDGQDPHRDVRHGQGHHEEVGDGLQVRVETHGPAHEHVPQDREHGDQQLQDDVKDRGSIQHGEVEVRAEDSWTIAAHRRPQRSEASRKKNKTPTRPLITFQP